MAIKYTFEESLVARQNKAEKEMLTELENGNYTWDNPLVKINPYFINPLAAVVLFKTEEEIAVTITVHGKEPEGTIQHTFPKSKTHVLPVLGLYADYENTVDIELYRSHKHTITIQTGPLPEDVPTLIKMETTHSYLRDEMIFVSPALTDLATAFDYKGDVRWHINIPTVFDIKRVKNGNILIGSHRLLKIPYYMSGIYEMTLVGKIVREYSIPGGYHHDEIELPNGNLLVLTEDLTSDTVEDMCVMVNRETGEIMKTWDYKDFLDPKTVSRSGSWTEEDWFHNNAVWYDENTNSLTFSGRHIDAMCNIDFDTGKLNWIIGDPEGWPEEYQKYFFKPTGDGEFDWQYEQHANLITPNGDVMCFDNGHWRSKNKDNYLKNKDNFSRGVRYKINTDDMTIQQVWQYGKERGEEFFSQYICNVEFYKEGHYMVHSGGIQYYGEHASEQFAALMQDDPNVRCRSITVELLDDVKMLELEVTGNFYRAEKLSLYHDGDNLPLGDGIRLGSMGVTKEFDTIIPMEPSGEELPYIYEPQIIEEDDRFTFKATFESGQLVMLMLEKDGEEHGYYISTARGNFAALCVGTFIEKDARKVSLSVNKAGLKGTYDVRVIVDDKKFDTGIQITC
ncbi:MAG TPA: aryl-sulfate sulfotransferase [Candidatus Fimiplasma intestinipullorum]|uniref:Aryl-sulfate sulfotransferase n=1 Tax=Candidatus Fimiplasma intestinipullorum TaxID=2840825 RepID=A0A9D1KZH3_9FIRM|nr:aryl-sulfate sulfotransferase [Candidatus Fimiplasma intestinipullorum]